MKWQEPLWKVWVVLVFTAVTATHQKPIVHLAYLVEEAESTLAVDFALDKFLNDSRRQILPDYDVVLDVMRFASHTADASARVVEAVTGETPYSAMIGPFPNEACVDTVNLTTVAQMLHVMNCGSTELTRQQYPNYFRVTTSEDGNMICWMHITSSNGWNVVMTLAAETAQIDLSVRLAARFNLTLFPILAEDGESWIVEGWQNNAVDRILATRSRVVYALLPTDLSLYQVVCYIHRRQVSGLHYFMVSDQQPDWFVATYTDSLVHCTPDEMYTAVWGHISTVHSPVAPGISGLGVSFPPLNGTSHANRALTCIPELTVEEFFVGGELLARGFASGDIYDGASAQIVIARAGFNADMLCVVLLALHDMIYNKGIDLTQIEQRRNTTYKELLLSTAGVDFQGASGEYYYPDGSGEPAQTYFLLMQRAVPGVSNVTNDLLATFTYPRGEEHAPLFVFLEEGGDFQWSDGSTGLKPKPELGLLPVCGVSNSELVGYTCHPCAAGKAYDSLLDACRTCSLGSYQSELAQSECVVALPGWYVNNTDEPIEALPCPRGYECPQFGTVMPQLCAQGRFASDTGRAACELCPVGRYQNLPGATGCADCKEVTTGSTTENIASTSTAACICPEEMFLQLGATECTPCPEGMECLEGSDMRNLANFSGTFPVALEGFMTKVDDALRVYKCVNDAHCPGGPPGTCAALRDPTAVACGKCSTGAYEAGDVCELCGDVSSLPLVFSCFLAVLVTAIATLLINRDMGKTSSASVTIVVMTGVLFTSLQAMGVFHQMPIPWVEPVKSMLRVTQIFTFEVKELRVNCVMGSSPVRSFAFRQAAPLIIIPIVVTTIWLKKACTKNIATRVRLESVNALGAMYTLFFISILLSALSPVLCYKHPGSNGESVLSDPSLLCFDSSDHINMAIISFLSIAAMPVPLAAACLFGVLVYPTYIAKSSSSRFFLAFRFLFFKYTPKRYYFQCIFLARSLCLCLIPAILRGQSSTQLLFICLLLAVYVAVVSQQEPWRNPVCNPLDAGMNVMLLVMLMCGALFLEDTPQKGAIAVLAMSAAIVVLFTGCAGLAMGLWARFVPHPWYHYFLCHHKAHAAAQTRYLKIVMQESRRSCHVFIDSDDLKQLDTLFDTVKIRVGHLVVYLTADTLKRPWCVGEIVSATRASVVITRVNTPTFVAPSEVQISEPQNYIDTAGCNLSEYHIHWDDVSETFHSFLQNVKQVELPTSHLGRVPLQILAGELLSMRDTRNSRHPSLRDVKFTSVVLCNDGESSEACAAGGILMARLTRDIFQKFDHGDCVLSDYVEDIDSLRRLTKQASAVVVILSEGCLMSASVMTVVCELEHLLVHTMDAPTPVSVNIPGFAFPTPNALDEISDSASGLVALYGDDVPALLKSFFKNISILLPTHASQEALDIQSAEIFRRISQQTSALRQSHMTHMRTTSLMRSTNTTTSSLTAVSAFHLVISSTCAPPPSKDIVGDCSDVAYDDLSDDVWEDQEVRNVTYSAEWKEHGTYF